MIRSNFGKQTTPVHFQSSDARLDAGFQWAKKQALAYLRRVHQLDEEAARRAARLGGRLAGGLLLLLLGAGSAVALGR